MNAPPNPINQGRAVGAPVAASVPVEPEVPVFPVVDANDASGVELDGGVVALVGVVVVDPDEVVVVVLPDPAATAVKVTVTASAVSGKLSDVSLAV